MDERQCGEEWLTPPYNADCNEQTFTRTTYELHSCGILILICSNNYLKKPCQLQKERAKKKTLMV